MSKTLSPSALADVLQQELGLYHKDVTDRVNEAGRTSIKKLLQLTKAKAPAASGDFKKSLTTSETDDSGTGAKRFTLHARPPKHRIFHLLVHGHATRNGGRVKGDPFLQNAVDQVLPEYEKAIEEALQ